MSSLIGDEGKIVPLTLLSVESNIVVGKRTLDIDGYDAVIIGAGNKKKLRKPQAGFLKNSESNASIIKEFRNIDSDTMNIGDKLNANVFNLGDKVSVTGTSKGKGWAGTIKRHNFHRGRKTHGGRSYRRVGSIGSMYPQHIFKGKKMPGRMGHVKVTTQGLHIGYIDIENNTIGVVGSVPGPNKGIVIVKEMK